MSITINTDDFRAIVNNSPTPNTSGFFVELMTSINAYVKGEFESGRITGTEYATVYLGAMQSAIAQSVQYASQKATSDAQAALLTAQKAQVEAETAISAEKLLGEIYTVNNILPSQLNESVAKVASLQAEADKTRAEISNVAKQGTLLDNQALEIGKNIDLKDAQISQVDAEITKLYAEILNVPKQGKILDRQATDIDKGIEVKSAEILKLNAESGRVNAEATKLSYETTVLAPKQGSLLDVKILSEQKTIEVASEQIILYAAQAKGFTDKSKVDSAKVLFDTLNMRMSLSNDVATGQSIADAFIGATSLLPYNPLPKT